MPLKMRNEELKVALQKQEKRVADSAERLAVSDSLISSKRQACDAVMKILDNAGSLSLVLLTKKYPEIEQFIKREMPDFQLMRSMKSDLKGRVSALISDLELKQKQAHEQHAQLEMQKRDLIEKQKAVSIKLRELDRRDVASLKLEQEGLLKISDSFAVLQREVVKKTNSLVSSKKGVDPALSKRVDQLIAQLDRYIEESTAVYERKFSRGETILPDRLALNEERVRLAAHLKNLLVHDAPTSEAG